MPGFPFRYNPVFVIVKRKIISKAVYADGYQEETAQQFEDPITVRAQPEFNRREWEKRRRSYSGDMLDSIGHLTCKADDLREDGWEPQKGDKIIKIAQQVTEFVVDEVRFESPTPPIAAGMMSNDHELVIVELGRDDESRQSEQR